MANIRIKDLSTDSALSAGDYVVIDSASEGSRKFDLGTEIADLKSELENISGISDDVKVALLDCFAHVAWTSSHGQVYYDLLEQALYAEEPKTLVSISAVYTQSGTVYDTDTLDSLKTDLVVTATWSDTSTSTVASADYTLSGTLTEGTSTITVSYGGKTTAFNVTVTLSRATRFGTFINRYSIAKVSSGNSYPQYQPFAYRTSTSARATTAVPFANRGYIFTVTDSTKYNINAVDVSSDEQLQIPNTSTAVDKIGYSCGSKAVSWAESDSVTTPFVWLALKKLDNTAFTDAELANGAEAVFTFTESNG